MENSVFFYRYQFWFLIVLVTTLTSCKPNQVDSEASAYKDLFNGKDLSGWYTYQRKPEPTSVVSGLRMENGKFVEPIGLSNDPLDVFSVVELDGEQVIRISGEVFGILVTDEAFENYHFSLEFKWGEKRYPPREDQKRDSGICYHSFGKEGAQGGVWMKSVECQIQEGDVGDLWCVNATTASVNISNVEKDGFTYDPSGLPKTFDASGQRHCRRSVDFEKPYGEWNTVDIYAVGNESIHVVNGHMNMHLEDMLYFEDGKSAPLTKGKIQLQSEGAEVYYRNIRIRSISEIPRLTR